MFVRAADLTPSAVLSAENGLRSGLFLALVLSITKVEAALEIGRGVLNHGVGRRRVRWRSVRQKLSAAMMSPTATNERRKLDPPN